MAGASDFRGVDKAIDLSKASCALSAKLVGYLLANGYTAQGLADALGLGKSFISLVKSGDRSFRLEHLQQIEHLTSTPLPMLLLRIADRESVPDNVRADYNVLSEFVEKNRSLRKSLKASHKAG